MYSIVIGQAGNGLSHLLAHHGNAQTLSFQLGQFADGEMFFSSQDLEKLPGSDVLVVYQFCLRFHRQKECLGTLNDQVMGLLQVLDCVKSYGADTVSLVLPYLPYARQDQSDYEKYLGGLYTFGKLLASLGVDRVMSCDLHNPAVIKQFYVQLSNISLAHFWVNLIQEQLLSDSSEDFCIATPDYGGLARARDVAHSLGLPVVCIEKERVDVDQAQAKKLVGDVSGKAVIIVDDIIATGRSAASATKLLKKHGAQNVYGCFSHAIFSSGAHRLLQESGMEKVFVTDTLTGLIPGRNDFCSIVTVSDFLAKYLSTHSYYEK